MDGRVPTGGGREGAARASNVATDARKDSPACSRRVKSSSGAVRDGPIRIPLVASLRLRSRAGDGSDLATHAHPDSSADPELPNGRTQDGLAHDSCTTRASD